MLPPSSEGVGMMPWRAEISCTWYSDDGLSSGRYLSASSASWGECKRIAEEKGRERGGRSREGKEREGGGRRVKNGEKAGGTRARGKAKGREESRRFLQFATCAH